MPRDDSIYLRHILDASAKVAKYTLGLDEAAFLASSLVQDAVIRQIEIIGEAVTKISQELQQGHTQIRWKAIAGMRHKLIHDYFGVDVARVWLTAINDIPLLAQEVAVILDELA